MQTTLTYRNDSARAGAATAGWVCLCAMITREMFASITMAVGPPIFSR
jgi:hypothetical protein